MLNVERQIDATRAMFRVHGIPRAKPRQTQADRWNPSTAVQHYRFWADLVRLAWRESFKGPPWEGAVAFGAVFQFPIPKSWPVAKRKLAMAQETPHTIKPDIDNLIKGVSDPLNGLAYMDDAQITQLIEPTAKIWAPPDHVGAWIIVERMP